MKVLTWNINGIRASKVKLEDLFQSLDADVICLQETKVTRDQLDSRSAIVEGYNAYFSFSQARSGYSGVATFVKDSAAPIKAEEGLSGLVSSAQDEDNIGAYGDQSSFTEEELQSLDNEGRTVITQHKIQFKDGKEEKLTIINVYCPRADPERDDRKLFKLRFYELLQIRAQALLEQGSHVIVLGDVNSSHRPIDNCDPGDPKEFAKHPGRKWLDQFLCELNKDAEESEGANSSHDIDGDSDTTKDTEKPSKDTSELDTSLNTSSHSESKFVDTFRYFHPSESGAYTCWNTASGAREFNYGTRIDYIFADVDLTLAACKDCEILSQVEGSDHCPVKVTMDSQWLPAKKCPPLCTKFMPEFAGRQQKLSSFFVKGSSKLEEAQPVASQDSCPEFPCKDNPPSLPLKRCASDSDPAADSAKKPKLEKQTSGSKQKSLLSFFGKPKSKSPISNHTPPAPPEKVVGTPLSDNTDKITSRGVQQKELNAEDVAAKMDSNVKAANVWKGLLKGPRAAPVCKGHKEPCVLRTVKKDGLNKGRQFYTCARGEGPKSNPEARCEHFEWVDKKKTKAS